MINRGFVFLVLVLFISSANAGVIDFITGKATEQQTNVSITVNGAPSMGNVDNPVLACEASSLTYLFNATGAIGETLSFSLSSSDPFFVRTYSSTSNATNSIFTGELYSVLLAKSHIANYSRTISVTDGTLSDSKSTNISVIEINNAPVMTEISDKSVLAGNNLYLKINVSDTEDGNQDSGNFSFNLTFVSGSPLFNISQSGIINKTFSSSETGSYVIRVCTTDLGIPINRRHANISYCGQDGTNQSDCDNFNLEVSETSSSTSSSGGSSGGGGGGGISCQVKWGCRDWDACENSLENLNKGEIGGDEFRIVSETCAVNNWDEKICGFQRRECIDVNNCKNNFGKPEELQACYYTENPSCIDGVKNCHDGGCEFLVDCGGPCGACATCTDGIQNQGEQGIDCGGPCPQGCIAFVSPEVNFLERFGLEGFDKKLLGAYSIIFSIFSILFIVLAIKLIRVMKLSRG